MIKTVITAQDILVDNSGYPSKEITLNTKKYRNLGLGYTNLGGLLMWLGIPYDSDDGRTLAAVLTALLTGIAYETSADLADKVGEFNRFENNKEPMFRVLNQHFEHVKKLPTTLNNNKYQFYEDIQHQSLNIWTNLQKRSKFRNAQTVLLAPTGTISFIMNSITTGIEPEFSLVKYKRLTASDGATIKIINPLVEEALENMGYDHKIIPYLMKELMGELPEDTPSQFRNNDKDVFLTASYLPGTDKCIDYMGHVKMCAAVQPFLSNSISKTVNLPKNITVDEIYNLYIEAWKLGLKGITVYRDGCKNFQPLTVEEEKIVETKELTRRKLPNERPAITHKFRIGNSDGYIICGMYPDTHELGEIFVNVSKEGSTLSGFADALATTLSIAIQYKVPLKEFVRKLSHLKFEPSGFTQNANIRTASSIVDYIARYIGLKFLPREDQIELGLIHSSNNQLAHEQTESDKKIVITHDQDINPICPNCGSMLHRLGSCYFCSNCAYDSGACG